MGNKFEPVVEVVWEPIPTKVKRPVDRTRWPKALEQVKAAPGTMPRVMRCQTRTQADYYVKAMRTALERDDPDAKWEFKTATMGDQEGGMGIWVSYKGKLTPADKAERAMKKKKHSDRMKKAWMLKKLRQSQTMEASIHPFPGAR